jgi:hypothetical protein
MCILYTLVGEGKGRRVRGIEERKERRKKEKRKKE